MEEVCSFNKWTEMDQVTSDGWDDEFDHEFDHGTSISSTSGANEEDDMTPPHQQALKEIQNMEKEDIDR